MHMVGHQAIDRAQQFVIHKRMQHSLTPTGMKEVVSQPVARASTVMIQ